MSLAKYGVYCRCCQKYVDFEVKAGVPRFAEHPCCACANCSGKCCHSGEPITRSKLPGWHPLHICGMFCDGQDGATSQCAHDKRQGPPDAVTRLGDLTK